MYRHDYNSQNPAPVSDAQRLYDADYFVMNKDFNVYVCIDNGSSDNTNGNASQDEPTFTGLEPSKAVKVEMDIFGNIFLVFLQVIL